MCSQIGVFREQLEVVFPSFLHYLQRKKQGEHPKKKMENNEAISVM